MLFYRQNPGVPVSQIRLKLTELWRSVPKVKNYKLLGCFVALFVLFIKQEQFQISPILIYSLVDFLKVIYHK